MKQLIAVAAEEDGKGIGRIRMVRIADYDRTILHGFIRFSVEPGIAVYTDGPNFHRELEGFVHHRECNSRLSPESICSRGSAETFLCSNAGYSEPIKARCAFNTLTTTSTNLPSDLTDASRHPGENSFTDRFTTPSRSSRQLAKGWFCLKVLCMVELSASPYLFLRVTTCGACQCSCAKQE